MKKIIIPIIIIIILIIGIYFLTQQTTAPDIGDIGSAAMIEGAYFSQGSVVCTFVNPETEYIGEEKAIVYIKNGNVRVSLEDSEQLSDPIVTGVLFKDGIYYFWEGNQGIKMSAKKDDVLLPFYVAEEENKVVYDEELSVSCQKTSIDNSIFDIPEGVEFFDMDAIPEDLEDYDLDQIEFPASD